MPIEIDLLPAAPVALGESPLWDHRTGRLWWVDSLNGVLRSSDGEGGGPRDWQMDQQVGSIGLADGGLIVALADGFYRFDSATGETSLIARPGLPAGTRLNDGKADRHGRFLAASLRIGDSPNTGSLFRLDPDASTTRIEHGVAIGNGLCFSPAGDAMHFADSMDGMLRRYPYDPETGAIGARHDGATVDRDGNIWVALVLAQAVACYDPSGRLIRTLAVPLPYPSCPAFGGPGFDTLYVTCIANSGHKLVADHPDAGRVMAIRGMDAVGLPEGIYR
jgi:sugar lactone lactonase YvrE